MEMSDPSPVVKTALDAVTDQSLRVPCYCEENVWRLAVRKIKQQQQQSSSLDAMDFYVVFVANPIKCVPMFHQLAASEPDKPCFWDYHVILLGRFRESGKTLVFDMDSRLSYPCNLEEYLRQVFPPDIAWKDQFRPMFRVITASKYIENFSSDRMHMYDKETKTWNATPPTYPCIQREGENNLKIYMTISEADKQQNGTEKVDPNYGTIYTLRDLKQLFSEK